MSKALNFPDANERDRIKYEAMKKRMRKLQEKARQDYD